MKGLYPRSVAGVKRLPIDDGNLMRTMQLMLKLLGPTR